MRAVNFRARTCRRSWLFLIFAVGSAPGMSLAATAQQPNPYHFPTARGVNIPIQEGYWATSTQACEKLILDNTMRLHVGLKSVPSKNADDWPPYTFRYLGPRLGNWPDGLCFVRVIKKQSASVFLARGYCGERTTTATACDKDMSLPGCFSGVFEVYDDRHVAITQIDENGKVSSEYFFCRGTR
jgi:hypothetical protein